MPVAYGFVSGAIPAISSARSRGSFLARLRRLVVGSPVERSILGARLRTRCPQYGHSVTYGLTSDPQFLQTTNRSGCDTVPLRVPGAESATGGYSPVASGRPGNVASGILPSASLRSWFAS